MKDPNVLLNLAVFYLIVILECSYFYDSTLLCVDDNDNDYHKIIIVIVNRQLRKQEVVNTNCCSLNKLLINLNLFMQSLSMNY